MANKEEMNWYLVAACLGLVLAIILFFLVLAKGC